MRNVGVRPENSLCGSTWPLVPTWDICFKYQHSFFFSVYRFFFLFCWSIIYSVVCSFLPCSSRWATHACVCSSPSSSVTRYWIALPKQPDLVVNPSCFTSSHLPTPNSPYFPGNTPIPGNLTSVSYRHGLKITSGPLCFLSASVGASWLQPDGNHTFPSRQWDANASRAAWAPRVAMQRLLTAIPDSILPSPEVSVILNVHGASSTMIWISKQLRSCSLQKRPFSFPWTTTTKNFF